MSLQIKFVANHTPRHMSHINLTIKQNNEIKPYIVVSAEYLNEAWLAEAYGDNSTKIIKQFKCAKFKNCFKELSDCMVHLGEIIDVSGSEIEERSVNRLRNILIHRPTNGIKKSGYFHNNISLIKQTWKWVQNSWSQAVVN